ncbi:MAG: FISUMP domain-containing protein [Parvicellaceae bacterium]
MVHTVIGFLPSKDEFQELYANIGPGNSSLGNIANIDISSSSNYYSSSEVDANYAWRIFPLNGVWTHNLQKSHVYNVRAIRAFKSNYNYNWTPINETTSSITVQPSATTTYTVDVTSGTTTCQSDVTVSVNQKDLVSIDSTACDSIQWNGNWLASTGGYYDSLQNIAGCDSIVTLNLTINPSPLFTFIQDTLIACNVDSILVDAGSGYNFYAWSNGANTQQIYAANSDTYSVTVTDANGCTASENVLVDILNADIVQNDTIICEGESIILELDTPKQTNNIGNNLLTGNITCENEYLNVEGCNGQTSITYNGYEYDLVEIGGQCWFKENLRTSYYSDGSSIFYPGTDNLAWENNTTGAYSWWQNDSTNAMSSNGALYNGYAVLNNSGVCPIGWTVPSDCDFMYLESSVGMGLQDQQKTGDVQNSQRGNYGIYLQSNLMGGNDSSGLNINSTGFRDGSIFGNSDNTSLWTSTLPIRRQFAPINISQGQVGRLTENLKAGIGIRCLKKTIEQNITYSWSSGETTASINPSPAVTTTYYVTVNNGINSCQDSVTVNVLPISALAIDTTVCDSIFFAGNNINTSGTYYDTLFNVVGCDSVVTLNLTINNSIQTSDNLVACDSAVWNGNVYTNSGIYYDTLSNAVGCDSVVMMDLTINNSFYSVESITACDSMTWNNGITYTQSGIYYDSLQNNAGCDSIIMLDLTINLSPAFAFSQDTIGACGGDSVLLDAGSGHTNYLWNTGASSSSIYASSTGMYSVTVSDSSSINLSNSLSFDGVDDRVVITSNNLPGGNSARSVSAWFYPEPGNGNIFAFGDGNSNSKRFSTVYGGDLYNNIGIRFIGQNNDYFGYNVTPNQWHFVTVTYSNNNLKLYVDGVIVDSTSLTLDLNTDNSYPLVIGSNTTNRNDEYFGGKIAQVSIWDRALNATDIQSHMNCPPSTNALGLLGYWELGDDANDATAYGNNGIIEGAIVSIDAPVFTCDNQNVCSTTDSIYLEILDVGIVQDDTTICQSDILELSLDLDPIPAIGDYFEGGYVFHIDSVNDYALIAGDTILGTAEYGCYGQAITGAGRFNHWFRSAKYIRYFK